jgi:hypothetical protein
MRPKKHETTGSGDLFRARLDQIINMKHELVQFAGKIDWDFLDAEIAPLYSDKGRPGVETRFVLGLLLLKHIYGLSDEGVCERWVYDPYFQHFTGEEYFQHEFPHERSDLTHWRKRLGDKLELLLAESLRVAHASRALRTKDLARVTIDTTVQPKNITFPTDAKLLHAASADQIRSQQQRQRGWKLYSFHAPEVEYIGKGKASAPYEFGVKASIDTTNRRAPGGQFVLRARALPGNPYDGHTLRDIIEATQSLTGRKIERGYVDKGYRGHGVERPHRIFISGQKRGVFGAIKRELRRRSAIEAVIGHMKADGHLGRCYLKGRAGDAANVVLSAVGYNLRLVLAWLSTLLRSVLLALIGALFPVQS